MNWNDPETSWLVITNLALGLVVLVCVLVIAVGVISHFIQRAKKPPVVEDDLDRELRALIASYRDGHAFRDPSLGITMADGGEPLDKK